MRNYWHNASFSCCTAVVLYALLQTGGVIPVPAAETGKDGTVLLILACGFAACGIFRLLENTRLPAAGAIAAAAGAGWLLLYKALSAMLPDFSGAPLLLLCLLIACGAAGAAAAAGVLSASIDAGKINRQLIKLRETDSREDHEQDH